MTERELVRSAQKGDDGAFEALVRSYEKRVYHLALRMCGNAEDAYEVAQEAFLSAWKGLRFFRGESSFSTWLYRLTSNAAIDFLRRQRRQSGGNGPSLDDEEAFLEVADPAPSPHQQAEQLELREAVARGLAALSPEHRQVLDLGTVKSRIARGREKLRKYLLSSGNFSGYLPSNLTEKEG